MHCFYYMLSVLLVVQVGVGQVQQRKAELNRVVPQTMRLTQAQQKEVGEFFERIGKTLISDSPENVTRMFDQAVHLALPGVEQGRFSRSQASQLLSSYLRDQTIVSFTVKKQEETVASPYLSALLAMQRDDREEQMSLYISLVRSDASWKIGHFSVY